MQALKAIVIGMGVLIVLAVGLLGYGLYKKSVEPEWKLFGPEAAQPGQAALEAFADIDLDLPAGCAITNVHADGARAYLTIGPDLVCNRVIVIDVRNGQVLGRIAP